MGFMIRHSIVAKEGMSQPTCKHGPPRFLPPQTMHEDFRWQGGYRATQ